MREKWIGEKGRESGGRNKQRETGGGERTERNRRERERERERTVACVLKSYANTFQTWWKMKVNTKLERVR